MKKLSLLLVGLATIALTACIQKKNPSGNSNSGDTPSINPNLDIVVNFYLDFNQVDAGNIYETKTVKNGSTVEAPTTPTSAQAPMPEFPVFLGWSKKEIIDDKKDLWNFETDKIETFGTKYSLYGIWVSQGES